VVSPTFGRQGRDPRRPALLPPGARYHAPAATPLTGSDALNSTVLVTFAYFEPVTHARPLFLVLWGLNGLHELPDLEKLQGASFLSKANALGTPQPQEQRPDWFR
jgi:hypothetical protein